MAMTHERLAVSSGLHTILANYRFSGSPNLQNPQPTTSLLEQFWVNPFEPQACNLNHKALKETVLMDPKPRLLSPPPAEGRVQTPELQECSD